MTTPAVVEGRATNREAFDVERARRDFPILSRTVHDKPLVYLDNAASTQKPDVVIDAVADTYRHEYANIHRGVHYLSERTTAAYEAVREKTRAFLNAGDTREVVFCRGTTDAINLVAHSFGRGHVSEGDEIVISALEHHSNIVPWQLMCEERGAILRVAQMEHDGSVLVAAIENVVTDRTKLVAMGHVSNALGTVNPVRQIADIAHAAGAVFLVDGAQAAPHLRVDVQALGADFYTVSAHKMFGPSGVGVLYGRAELLESMPPYQGGGDMIRNVAFEGTTYAPIPSKFEAGTPNIAGVVGMGAAIDYLGGLDWNAVVEYEDRVLAYALEQLQTVDGVTLIGTPRNRTAVVSFLVEGVHAHDVGTIVDREGVAIRTGHHCAQPVMNFYGVEATARASFALYNTHREVDVLVNALRTVRDMFR